MTSSEVPSLPAFHLPVLLTLPKPYLSNRFPRPACADFLA